MRNRAPLISCRSIPALNKRMVACGNCPRCDAGNEQLVAVSDREYPATYTIECRRCAYMGPWAVNLKNAVHAWRTSKP